MKVHQYGMEEGDDESQVEIKLVKIGESNSHQENPSDDMIK
jgi:hypothetical protein